MQQYMFHKTKDSEIYGVLSILDYEPTVKSVLEKISFPPSVNKRYIIVDLALKSGLNQYRFLLLEISKEGDIIWKRSAYYNASSSIEKQANAYLKEKADIVLNSALSNNSAIRLLSS